MTGVSIIVPCRNEGSYIDAFLEGVYAQRIDTGRYELEVIVADGASDDGTRERLAAWQQRQPSLKVIDNAQRIVSTGLNQALRVATGAIVIRMDVHTTYASDYVAECIAAMQASKAACVGGPWRAVGTTGLQAAIAEAFMSRIGSGGARSREISYSGSVDTVYLGAWPREVLENIGGFDESLVRNQDDELNLRLKRAGHEIWQSASIRSSYVPRASFSALFRQFYQYGYWKVPVIRKHRLPASPRQLAPFAFVSGLALLVLLSVFSTAARWLALVTCGGYFLALLAASGVHRRPLHGARVAIALACMHFGYGLGFARGLIDLALKRKPGQSAARLTR